MKIRRKNKFGYIRKNKPIGSDNYVEFEPQDFYSDSSVSRVFIKKEFILSIIEWVLESKTQNPVPEVGGFILGNYWGNDLVNYEISLEQFIASRLVKDNSPVMINFGPQAMVELAEAKDKHSDLSLLGWFHTHPGHTPYLSDQDLTIHENFFTEKYQIAIVLDSLTDDFLSVLVCRKENGEINKSMGEEYWFNWKQLLN